APPRRCATRGSPFAPRCGPCSRKSRSSRSPRPSSRSTSTSCWPRTSPGSPARAPPASSNPPPVVAADARPDRLVLAVVGVLVAANVLAHVAPQPFGGTFVVPLVAVLVVVLALRS